jgi:hypothetical protein
VQRKEGRRKKLFIAKGEFRTPDCGRRMTAGCRPALSIYGPFFIKKLEFFFIYFGKFGEWAKPFGRMGVQRSHFLNLAPTLGRVKSSIPHGVWRFYFFPNFIFAKIRAHLDLHIHHWDFSFMKK